LNFNICTSCFIEVELNQIEIKEKKFTCPECGGINSIEHITETLEKKANPYIVPESTTPINYNIPELDVDEEYICSECGFVISNPESGVCRMCGMSL
jgi:predicted RNA-binding Zn-ribbon protein involved in translation (DUF1610 family)